MKEIIKERLKTLRSLMTQKGISAYLINGSDPHLGEYLPSRWETRSFISGFTGSYGWLAITLEEAVLWTDSRYYLQYEIETEGTGISLEKARLPETIPVEVWVSQRLKPGDSVGFDGSCYPASEVNRYIKLLSKKGIRIESHLDLLDEMWPDRPGLPEAKAFLHPVQWAGLSRKEKFKIIYEETLKQNSDITIISALDDLCWTFNIRGNDVDFNPLVLGYGIISKGNAILFIDKDKFDEPSLEELKKDGVEILPYGQFYSYISKIEGEKILIDPDRTNFLIEMILREKNHISESVSIPNLLKSRKNEAEIEGFRKANISDGVALLDFVNWIENNIEKTEITEWDAVCKLDEFRSKRPGYRGSAFYPIIGYKDHGAIVHLHVSKEFSSKLEPDGVLLFDSGGQYDFGTIDTTRTIALGPVDDDVRRDFTLALKGVIALSTASFPKGTIGCHLDVLVRNHLWRNKMNYGHGTSHGVGSFLNVHEGPMSIRQDLNNQPICPGNVISVEPGIYRTGKYGVRTENVIVCIEDEESEFGEFLKFETLTVFPIDTRLINKDLLSNQEIDWINNYHESVYSKLSPLVSSELLNLLELLTQPI